MWKQCLNKYATSRKDTRKKFTCGMTCRIVTVLHFHHAYDVATVVLVEPIENTTQFHLSLLGTQR